MRRLIRLGYPLYCGGRTEDLAALTFDDGPGPYSERVLELLSKYRMRGTFFVSGTSLATYGRVTRTEARLAALGSHSWNHVDLTSLPPAEVRFQLTTSQRAMEHASGAQVELFRPPYGAYDETVIRTARGLGMLLVIWSIDSGDSEGNSWKRIGATVTKGLRPGSIVLMHENRGQTVRALHRIILPALHRSGVRAVTIPELLALDPPTKAQLRRGLQGC